MVTTQEAIEFFRLANQACFDGKLVEPHIRVVKKTKFNVRGYFAFSTERKSAMIVLCPALMKRTNWKKVLCHEMAHCLTWSRHIVPNLGKSFIHQLVRKTNHTEEFWEAYYALLRMGAKEEYDNMQLKAAKRELRRYNLTKSQV